MSARSWLRKHGTAAVLVALAVALGVAVWLDRRAGPAPDAAGSRALLLAALQPDAVDRIIVRRGDDVLELRAAAAAHDGTKQWAVGAGPDPELADERAVAELLAKLGLARSERVVDSTGLGPDALGLAPPSWQIELVQRRRRLLFAVGAEAPSPPGARYASVREWDDGASPAGPSAVFVVSRELALALDELSGRLRTRGLVAGGGTIIARVVLRDPGGAERWTLEHVPAWGRGPEGYRLSTPRTPHGVRADWRPVEALLATLRALEIDRFANEPPSSPAADGGTAERFSVEVRGSGDERTALSIAGACGGAEGLLVVRTAPSRMVGCVPAKQLVALDVVADRLIDRHVVGASASLVSEVKLARGEQAVEVARRGHGWIMRAPREGDADTAAVDAWLSALLELSGEVVAFAGEPIDRAALGLDPASATGRFVSVGVGSSAQGATERIEPVELGAVRGAALHLLRVEDGAVLRLDPAAARVLAPDGLALRDPTVLGVAADHIVGIDVTAQGERQRVDWSAEQSSWLLREPSDQALRADPALVGEVVERLSKLRALRWVDAASAVPTGLDRPWCSVALRFGPPRGSSSDEEGDAGVDAPREGAVRFAFGKESAGGFFAQLEGEPAPFVAPRQAALLACGWLLDRGALLLDLASVTKITLQPRAASAALSVTPAGNEWQAMRGTEPVAGAGAIVRDALDGLFAEAAVRVGAAAPEEQLDRPQLEVLVEQRPAAGSGGSTVIKLRIGAGDSWRGTSVFYVRRSDVPATYVVAQGRLRALLDLF